MPGLKPEEKNTCENCGTQAEKRNIVRHMTRCSAGPLTCFSCTNFSSKSRAEMNYYLTKKHSKATAGVVQKCKLCDKVFHSFYL